MNAISFRLRDEDGKRLVEIAVDGRSLIDLVREYEQPFADREGAPGIAGGYGWLPLGEWLPNPTEHFLGRPAWPGYFWDGRTQILECTCGEPGCWPLLCRIEVEGDQVRWRDFVQPHRTAEAAKAEWRYERLGVFTFDRAAYEASLVTLGSSNK